MTENTTRLRSSVGIITDLEVKLSIKYPSVAVVCAGY